MSPIEDLIHEHKAIKVRLVIVSKIAENIKTNKGFNKQDVEKLLIY